MKFCEICGVEISTRDGENRCQQCEEIESAKKEKRERARKLRKAREDVLKSLGLVKVKGAMGGVYWE